MTVIHGDYPSRKPGETRSRDTRNQEVPPKREAREKASAAPLPDGALDSTGGKIRERLVAVQRAISRQQRLIGGLVGLRDMLQSGTSVPAGQVDTYIAAVVYQGERVLEPLRQVLQGIAGRGDLPSLEKQIHTSEQDLARLSVSLGKYEIADQNARSLAAWESLSAIAQGLRKEGGLPQRLSREHVLKLLG